VVIVALGCSSSLARAAEPPLRADSAATDSLRRGRYLAAVRVADAQIWRDPDAAWAYYDRGVALSHLGRVDEAARSFQDAENRFAPTERWGKSVAAYARANVFDEAGRCVEAGSAYEAYADLVADRPDRVERARAYAAACRPRAVADPGQSAVSSAVISGQYAEALLIAVRDTSNALYLYNRAVALNGLGRTDEAVETFMVAEHRFGNDDAGRAVSLWGAARALDQVGRCAEAKSPYERYAAVVAVSDPESAQLALTRARGCAVRPPALVAARDVPVPTPVAARQ
jgi:tetratricopeptide (TPR) repeat protein